ncbi:MAG: hypothetical protein RLN96_07320, partial [Pseudomonadales bacterium]
PTEAPTRWGHAMVFDRKRGRTMMFGGIDNLDIRGDVWECSTFLTTGAASFRKIINRKWFL